LRTLAFDFGHGYTQEEYAVKRERKRESIISNFHFEFMYDTLFIMFLYNFVCTHLFSMLGLSSKMSNAAVAQLCFVRVLSFFYLLSHFPPSFARQKMPVGVFCPYFGVFHSLFSKFCVFYIIEQTVIVLFNVVDITGYSMHFISYLYRHGCLLALLCIVVIVAPNCIFAAF